MSALRITRLWRALGLVSLVALCWVPRAEPQFETPGRQFHNDTSFPLDGRHRDVPCASCHPLQGTYKGTPTKCFDCHWVRRQDDRYRLQLGSQCDQCHRTTSWTDARWDHVAMTGMSLGVAHRQASCQLCHTNDTFRVAQTNCYSCHQRDYQSARTPNHAAAGFPTQCEACHRVSDAAFQQARFDHAASYPLVGVHAQQRCASCHKGDLFKGTPRDCVGCHRPVYDRTTAPNHAAAGFQTTCESCHRPTDPAWSGPSFNHAAAFALVGRHAQTVCASCHVNNVYKGTPRDCVGCHRPAYDRTTAPNHAAVGFPTACEGCHRPTDQSWQGGRFNHSSVFALAGRHAQTACTSCHVNSVYRGTPRDCIGCHRAQYDRTTAPSHLAAGFTTTCESCHRADAPGWAGAGFNHSSVFALVGRHAQTACVSCHANNRYRGTPRDCVGCHLPLYQRTTAPNHAAAGFPTTCESCHRATDTSWNQGTFNHRFPITSGPHRTTCATCHQGGNVQVFTCLVCHEHDRTRMDDKHRERAGYRYDSLACYSCHPNGRH